MPNTPSDAMPAPRAPSAAVFLAPLSAGGVVLGALLLALSLTPSMVPRPPLLQGALGGIVFAVGYGIWYLLWLLLDWLEVRRPPAGVTRMAARSGLAAAGLAVVVALWLGAGWQNSIRAAWDLPETTATTPVTVAAIAAAVAAVLLLLGRAFRRLALLWSRRSKRVLPPKLANLLGLVTAAAIFGMLIDGVLLRAGLRFVDTSARLADAVIPADSAAPEDPLKSGSAASLVAWEDLGNMGRDFVTSGPTAEEIGAFWGEASPEPLRVYVGLNAAAKPEARARLAFEELKRVGGFDREILVIAMPTGSGWLDPGAMDSLDYIARGDVATVAVQYSYLPSPISVVVDPTHGLDEAQALFDLVYGHWTTLPEQGRPRLYLHGLSLGAFLSQETVPLLDVLGDPFQGALWTGSPFLSDAWNMVLRRRQPDSPAWRPVFGNGSLIRTDNQFARFEEATAEWGPIRLVFLQYGSDAITFFDWSLAWQRPDWLAGERAPDLSPQMRWVPLVTVLQVAVDMAVSVGHPGYGHDYIGRHYIPAWAATLAPEVWDTETEERLIRYLSEV